MADWNNIRLSPLMTVAVLASLATYCCVMFTAFYVFTPRPTAEMQEVAPKFAGAGVVAAVIAAVTFYLTRRDWKPDQTVHASRSPAKRAVIGGSIAVVGASVIVGSLFSGRAMGLVFIKGVALVIAGSIYASKGRIPV